jgi:hypothetical protein
VELAARPPARGGPVRHDHKINSTICTPRLGGVKIDGPGSDPERYRSARGLPWALAGTAHPMGCRPLVGAAATRPHDQAAFRLALCLAASIS